MSDTKLPPPPERIVVHDPQHGAMRTIYATDNPETLTFGRMPLDVCYVRADSVVSPDVVSAVQCVEQVEFVSTGEPTPWAEGFLAAKKAILAALKALTQPAVADEKAGEPNCECGYPHDFDNPYK